MLAAALLASRLPTATHVFMMLSLAAQLFAVLPIGRDALRARSEPAFAACVLACAAIVAVLCVHIAAPRAAVTYAVAVAVVSGACPAAFYVLQPLKREINGPWDVRLATR